MNAELVRRRAGALVALLFLLLSLAGCSQSKESPGPSFKGTLVLWAAPGLAGYSAGKAAPAGDWFTDRAKAYEALHPQVQVQVRLFGSPGELEQALTAPPAAGQAGPDMAFGRFLPELAPRLADLEPAMGPGALADYLPNALEAFRTGGQLHGLPALLEVQVLALNEQAFADAEVALPTDGKWTLTQFEDSLKKLSGTQHFGLGYYQLPGYHEWYPLAGGLFRPDGSVAPGAATGLERLIRYRQAGWSDPDSAKVKAEETWAGFARKRFAIMPAGSWVIPLLRAEPYNVKLAVAGFPGDITAGYTYGLSVFRQEDPARQGAAIDLAGFLAAPDELVRLARQTGLMPARKSAGNPFEGDPLMTRAFQLAAAQQPLPAGPARDRAEPQIARELLYALIGGKAPDAALEQVGKFAAGR